MASLVFSPETDEALSSLERDPGTHRLAARIHRAFDDLEVDPGDARNRRRCFNTLGVWGIAVVADDDEEWLILWEALADDEVLVHHIVPAP